MSTTSFAVNDPMTVKVWSKKLAVAERDSTDISDLTGEDANSIIHAKPETSKGPGDEVTFGLRKRLVGEGKTENETAEGNGENLAIYSDKLKVNELGHIVGVKSENTIDQQRVPFDLREEAKDGLAEWWSDRKSMSFFAQMCGFTPLNAAAPGSGTKFTGLNAVTGATNIVRPNVHTTDEALTATDVFTLDLIDKAVERATTGDNKIRPVMIGKQKKYVCYLHPYQVTSMRTNASQGQWLDIQKAALAGGKDTESPIYTGALGEYNNVILRTSQDVTLGVNSTNAAMPVANTRRAVLMGAQAAVMAYGRQGGNPQRYRWNEELLDHKRKLEVSAWAIWGLKKAVYDGKDHAVITISSYARAS